MKEKLANEMKSLLKAYRSAPGALAVATIGKRAAGNDSFFRRLDHDFYVGTRDRVVQWFSDNWLDDGSSWPSDIFRPKPANGSRAAAA